jgi:NAD(P)-dependent dehydrogenase (short-subunit alcohol dehydrogenase family)
VTPRSALITGGSAGIGLAIAKALAEDGWNLTLAARDHAKLNTAAQALRVAGHTVHTIAVNLADDVAETVVTEHLETHGGLDLLVNNAGVGLVGPMEMKTARALELEIGLNFRSAYRAVQAAIPALRKSALAHGASYVVNVSSMTAREAPPNASAYAATKAALVALSGSAHKELSPDGIHVTALLPGFVDTPGTGWADGAMRERMLLASDVAEAVRFLLRVSPRCFIPDLMLTSAGAGLHELIDWNTVS